MMNYNQFRSLVVEPTLQFLDEVIPYSEEAVDLLMMTAAHESNRCSYIKQINGPALGVYQMEPATHHDIYKNFLKYNPAISSLLRDLTTDGGILLIQGEDMVFNLAYATAMARVHYYRVPEALPNTLEGLAAYAKKYYNTNLGKATAEDYLKAFKRWRAL